MSKVDDLRGCAKEELNEQFLKLCEEIFALENERRMQRKLEKPHLMKEKKKQRARVLTILDEKERE